MAQKVLIQLVDDLDGTSGPDVSTVLFGLDGATYDIDLSDANAQRLRDLLAAYVEAARRVGGRVTRATKSGPAREASSAGETGPIRLWAQQNGFDVGARGRIPANVLEAYQQAQAKAGTRKGAVAPKHRRGGKKG